MFPLHRASFRKAALSQGATRSPASEGQSSPQPSRLTIASPGHRDLTGTFLRTQGPGHRVSTRCHYTGNTGSLPCSEAPASWEKHTRSHDNAAIAREFLMWLQRKSPAEAWEWPRPTTRQKLLPSAPVAKPDQSHRSSTTLLVTDIRLGHWGWKSLSFTF